MSWIETLTGKKKPSSRQIEEKELPELKEKWTEIQNRIVELEQRHRDATMDALAGGKADTASIRDELTQARMDLEVIGTAINDLETKLSEAKDREQTAEIERLQKKRKALEDAKQKRVAEFLDLAGQAAGIWAEIERGSFKAGGNHRTDNTGWTTPIPGMTDEMWKIFREGFSKTNTRKIPFIEERQQIQAQIQAIKEVN